MAPVPPGSNRTKPYHPATLPRVIQNSPAPRPSPASPSHVPAATRAPGSPPVVPGRGPTLPHTQRTLPPPLVNRPTVQGRPSPSPVSHRSQDLNRSPAAHVSKAQDAGRRPPAQMRPAPLQQSIRPATRKIPVVQRMVLWANSDHEDRAKDLAKAVGETAAALSGALDLSKSKDTTLTIWGHGNAVTLGGLTHLELAKSLLDSKLADSSLQTIELITCDSSNPLFASNSSYAEKLAKELTKHTVKTLPMGTGASKANLRYWPSTQTFMYIIAENETKLREDIAFIQDREKTVSLTDIKSVLESMGRTVYLGKIGDIRGILTTVGGSSSCFLTTACVEAMELADNCWELTSLRRFRDTFLTESMGGRQMISQYYQIAPMILQGIRSRPDSQAILRGIHGPIHEIARWVCLDRKDDAVAMYRRLVLELMDRYLLPVIHAV